MSKQAIHSTKAPAAIGPYSQAVRHGDTVYCSGQIPLDPASGELVGGDITTQTRQVFDNLAAVAEAAGASLGDAIRIGIYLTDLDDFAAVNAVMEERFEQPFPARATVEVAGLPKGVAVEIDAILAVA